ncbi:MAG: hypothetical protein HZB23_15740 [Deltaproteobacteria bacterium]|nr:hypothetical protein [Deltaproteobacteria bacterium]
MRTFFHFPHFPNLFLIHAPDMKGKSMRRIINISILALLAMMILVGGHLTLAGVAPGFTPESITALVADQDARDPGGADRLPLILVHGWMGSSTIAVSEVDGTTVAEKAGFKKMMDYIYDGPLKNKYKIFRFHYESDKLSDTEIAHGLQIRMDSLISTGVMADKQVVLVAHSNGGLVSRSYMAEQTHTFGKYSGQKGGERVIRLITLGSPHHGTVIDNGDAKVADSPDWQGFATFFDLTYAQGKAITEPNRSDLKWDNYNNLPGYDAPNETNTWLAGLNAASLYTGKIIAYYAGTESPDYTWIDLLNYLHARGGIYTSALLLKLMEVGYLPRLNNPATFPVFGPYPVDIPANSGIMNTFVSASHRHFYNSENDGLIAVDSASGAGLQFMRTEFFAGFDHMDLRNDHDTHPAVFAKLALDLDAAYAEREIPAPVVPKCFIESLAA